MKKFLAAVLAMVLALCMVSAAMADTIKLTVWVGANEDLDWINGVIENFKAAHPDNEYDIQVGVQTEGDAASTVLSDPTAAADVFTFADDQFNSLINAGALQNLTEMDGIIDTNAVIAANNAGSVAASTGTDGNLYAFPATADNGYFMFYNKAYFTEEDVQTLDKMLNVAAAAGKYVGFPMANGWYLYSFFAGAGLEMTLSDDGVTNICNWNATDTPITGVQVAQALLDIAANPGFTNADSDPFVAGVKDGSIIAGVSGTWNADVAKECWGDDYAAVKLPTFTVNGEQVQMASFAGYKLVGVNTYSANVFDAVEFADYMTNEESQMSRFNLRSQGPSNNNAAASEEVQAAPAIAALAAQAAYATVQRVGDAYWTPAASLGQILAQGNPDGTDLQTMLDTCVEGITASQLQ